MKKSLQIAIEEARKHSLEFPNITVRVMDKPRKSAVVTASEWTYRERILDGWHTVVIFAGGQEVTENAVL